VKGGKTVLPMAGTGRTVSEKQNGDVKTCRDSATACVRHAANKVEIRFRKINRTHKKYILAIFFMKILMKLFKYID
jgi:hypothetical protein